MDFQTALTEERDRLTKQLKIVEQALEGYGLAGSTKKGKKRHFSPEHIAKIKAAAKKRWAKKKKGKSAKTSKPADADPKKE